MSEKLKNDAVPWKFQELYLNDELADVNFVFTMDDKMETLPANKSILGLSSPVFKQMFFGALKERSDVKIVDVSSAAFKEFLQFFYMAEVSLTMENITEVIFLAHKYDTVAFCNIGIKYLKTNITLDRLCVAYQLAIMLKIENLRMFCESKIEMFPLMVFKSDAFLYTDKIVLKNILELELLQCGESDVFSACLVWAKSQCKEKELNENDANNLRIQLDDCLHLIRFDSMNLVEFVSFAFLYKNLFTLEEYEDIISSKTIKDHKLEKFNSTLKPRMGAVYWTDKNMIKCDSVKRCNSSEYYIRTQESTFFSTSRILALGKISFLNFPCMRLNLLVDLQFTLKIIEIVGTSFEDSNAIENIIFDQNISHHSFGHIYIDLLGLPRPLVIKPGRMYEIRVDTPASFGLFHLSDHFPVVNLNYGIVVNFHHNSSDQYSNRRGLVDCLFFNLV